MVPTSRNRLLTDWWAMNDARDGRRWQHREHLCCRRFASVAQLIISCAVFSLNVLIVKRTGLIPVRYPNLSSYVLLYRLDELA